MAATLAVGVLAYAVIVVLLRISGKRTLSKWNAFDLVVTVALGSSLATTLLSRNTSLADGVVAFATLIGLQLAITWLSVRIGIVAKLVKARPALLLYRGELLGEAMKRQRVTDSEVLAAVRGHGIADLKQAGAVVLETDGSFSVIAEAPEGERSTLCDARRCGRRLSPPALRRHTPSTMPSTLCRGLGTAPSRICCGVSSVRP